jgi:transposase-like protein
MRSRKIYKPEFKAQIVQELAEGKESLNEVASKHQIAPATLVEWQKIARKNLYLVFQKREELEKTITQKDDRIAVLERKVGQLTVECDWLGKKSGEIIKSRRTSPAC